MSFMIEDCVIKGETPLAILVESADFDTTDCSEWIPKTMVSEESSIWKKGERGDLFISEWFARKKGWI